MTATDECLFRGAARAALATGVPVSIRFGADAMHDLDVVLGEGLPADRVVVGGLDRRGRRAAGAPLEVVRVGAYAAIDTSASTMTRLPDRRRARALWSPLSSMRGTVTGSCCPATRSGSPRACRSATSRTAHVLTTFVPLLRAEGLSDEAVQRILVDNPRDLLTRR